MLNPEQQAAVHATDSKLLCLAGAGTGKTTVMIARISELVDKGVAPESILALTFTNVAALEMKDRYEALHPNQQIPEFRTFHSFCYYILSNDKEVRYKLKYEQVPEIADESAEKRILKEAMMQVGIKLSEKQIRNSSPLTQKEAYDLMIVLKAANRIMRKRNLITFNMLCKEVCELFTSDVECIHKYKERFKYVFSDEYQDTDKIQNAFVQSFTSSKLFVVGDALQALYAFRGADSSIIKNLASNEEWATYQLKHNYRSTKPICEYANKFSKSYASDEYRVAIESDVEGPEVEFVNYEQMYGSVPHYVIKDILHRCKEYPGSNAILTRTNADVASIKTQLDELNVSYISTTQHDISSNILKSVLDNQYSLDWLSTYLTAQEYSDYIRRSVIRGSKYTLATFISEFDYKDSIVQAVTKIYNIRKLCKSSKPDLARSILKVLDHEEIEPPVFKSQATLAEKLAQIEKAILDYQKAGSIYVGTVHSVKGLEYDNVYVVGASGSSWKLNTEENHNVFYVAITRAKTHLTIFFAQ